MKTLEATHAGWTDNGHFTHAHTYMELTKPHAAVQREETWTKINVTLEINARDKLKAGFKFLLDVRCCWKSVKFRFLGGSEAAKWAKVNQLIWQIWLHCAISSMYFITDYQGGGGWIRPDLCFFNHTCPCWHQRKSCIKNFSTPVCFHHAVFLSAFLKSH